MEPLSVLHPLGVRDGDVSRLLVSLTGDVAVECVLSFVESLIGDRDIGVSLFIADGESETIHPSVR
jgi:hypothetical protein